MILQVPDKVVDQAGCGSDDLMFGLVVGLFYQGRLSLGQASEALGMTKPAFMDHVYDLGLPMPYGVEDMQKDLSTLERLWPSKN